MTIRRWGTQYNIIDYTPNSESEENFARRWFWENRHLLHNFQVNSGVYTFKAINAVIAEFDRELDSFIQVDKHLQEMEAYFNEH